MQLAKGVYRFLACPIGISTAPGEYQARMAHKVLEGFYLNGAVVYIDDTVIYGENEKHFLQMLDMVLDRMAKLNVRLKPTKSSFGMTSVEFLGHIFDEKRTKGSRNSRYFYPNVGFGSEKFCSIFIIIFTIIDGAN